MCAQKCTKNKPGIALCPVPTYVIPKQAELRLLRGCLKVPLGLYPGLIFVHLQKKLKRKKTQISKKKLKFSEKKLKVLKKLALNIFLKKTHLGGNRQP